MKKIRILLPLFQKLLFPALLVSFLIGAGQLSLVRFGGTYRYHTQVQRIFTEIPGLEGSLYAMRYTGISPGGEEIQDTKEALSQCSGVQKIWTKVSLMQSLQYNGDSVSLVLYPPELLEQYPTVTTHRKFSDSGLESQKIQAINASPHLTDFALGEILTLDGGDQKVEVLLIGEVDTPCYMPFFNMSSSKMDAQTIIREANMLAVPDTAQVRELLTGRLQENPNFFVLLQENATEEEREEILLCLQQNGYQYCSYDDILANTEKLVQDRLQDALPLPLYVGIISFTMTLCVALLFLQHSQETLSVYLLCGCSRRRGLGLILAGLGSLAGLASMANLLLLFWYKLTDYNIDNFLLDGFSIALAIAYTLCLLLTVTVVILLLYRTISLVQVRKGAER